MMRFSVGCAAEANAAAFPAAFSALLMLAMAWPDATARAEPRIVALGPNAYELIASLKVRPVAGDMPYALDARGRAYFQRYFFADATTVPRPSNADGTVNAEAVAVARPDLILADVGFYASPQLAAIAPVMEVAGFRAHWDGMIADVNALAARLGREEQAREAERAFRVQLDSVVERWVASGAARRSVARVSLFSDFNRMVAITRNNATCAFIETIARCVAPAGRMHWASLSAEGLLALDADVLIVSMWAAVPHDEIRQRMRSHPLLRHLRAVREGRVAIVPDSPSLEMRGLRSGARVLDLVPAMIYPEVFGAPASAAAIPGSDR